MYNLVQCPSCVNNRCYLTGFDPKCGHDNGWARLENQSGAGNIMECSKCNDGNKLYITGYDKKCQHDNGWAFSGGQKVECSFCKNNRCYLTGYDVKCGHDNGWAYPCHKSGKGQILECSFCKNGNRLYITGYSDKCGHDNGWAYSGDDTLKCTSCLNNKCYLTGYSKQCGHDNGWAKPKHKSGIGKVLECKMCNNGNKLYITGFDVKCGHDQGWAYSGEKEFRASCFKCKKKLQGTWSLESNPENTMVDAENERFWGIKDCYFLNKVDSPERVYSFCKACWIKEINEIQIGNDIKIKSFDQEKMYQMEKDIKRLENELSLKNVIIGKMSDFNDVLKVENQDLRQKNDELKKLQENWMKKMMPETDIQKSLEQENQRLKIKLKETEENLNQIMIHLKK